MAYVYPSEMRSTRDLLRRRNHLARKRAELLAHVQNTNHQYNLPNTGEIAYKSKRKGVVERFPDISVQKSVELDLALLNYYDQLLLRLEHELSLIAKVHDADSYFRIRSLPGIGRILGLVILYEIHNISHFPHVQDFVSYCRLVKSACLPVRQAGMLSINIILYGLDCDMGILECNTRRHSRLIRTSGPYNT